MGRDISKEKKYPDEMRLSTFAPHHSDTQCGITTRNYRPALLARREQGPCKKPTGLRGVPLTEALLGMSQDMSWILSRTTISPRSASLDIPHHQRQHQRLGTKHGHAHIQREEGNPTHVLSPATLHSLLRVYTAHTVVPVSISLRPDEHMT